MHFRITADTNQESGIGSVVEELSGPTRQHFASRDYGSGLPRLCVVIMCRDPKLEFKRRVRFSKQDQTLYMDVMLHLPDLVPLGHSERRRAVLARLKEEIREVLTKYKFQDFDQPKFEAELCSWFSAAAA
jgi:hypothetical protein